MLFVVRIYEMLNLSHGKLSDSQKALLGMDLISEAKTDLSRSEGHATVIIIEETSEVNEDTLSSLGSKEPSLSAGGSNLSLEHKVERKSL
jgi:hypothetical protein